MSVYAPTTEPVRESNRDNSAENATTVKRCVPQNQLAEGVSLMADRFQSFLDRKGWSTHWHLVVGCIGLAVTFIVIIIWISEDNPNASVGRHFLWAILTLTLLCLSLSLIFTHFRIANDSIGDAKRNLISDPIIRLSSIERSTAGATPPQHKAFSVVQDSPKIPLVGPSPNQNAPYSPTTQVKFKPYVDWDEDDIMSKESDYSRTPSSEGQFSTLADVLKYSRRKSPPPRRPARKGRTSSYSGASQFHQSRSARGHNPVPQGQGQPQLAPASDAPLASVEELTPSLRSSFCSVQLGSRAGHFTIGSSLAGDSSCPNSLRSILNDDYMEDVTVKDGPPGSGSTPDNISGHSGSNSERLMSKSLGAMCNFPTEGEFRSGFTSNRFPKNTSLSNLSVQSAFQ